MAVCEVAKSRDMRLLPGGRGQRQGRLVTGPGDSARVRFGGEAEKITLEDMRHDETGGMRDGAIHGADGIADEALQFPYSLDIGRKPRFRHARQGQAECILESHANPSIGPSWARCASIQPILKHGPQPRQPRANKVHSSRFCSSSTMNCRLAFVKSNGLWLHCGAAKGL